MSENETTVMEPVSFDTATGPIKYTLKSDLLFHYVMQKSPKALMGLVGALKGIKPEDIKSIEILNPIELNSNLKETVMDLKLIMNSGEILNIEIQTYFDKNWEKRSILYLCRAFDSIKQGEDYTKLKPTTHFCITDKDLLSGEPEFYSQYMLLNVKTHAPYTKLIGLNMLQLNHIELATDEDEENNLVYWAKLFNATTWEEFKALAENNPEVREVGDMVLTLNTDNQAAEILEGQRRYREMLATARAEGVQETEEKYEKIIADKDAELAEKDATIAAEVAKNAALQAEIERLKSNSSET